MTTYTGLQFNDTSTLQGIIQAIYFQGKCNSSTFQANDLLRIVNEYYAQLQEVVKSVNENFYMCEATADLVIGDGTYTFPDGTGTAPAYDKVKSIWAAFLPANPAAPLTTEYQRVIAADPDAITNPAYTFSTPTALMFGTYFTLLPIPIQTPTNTYPVTDGVKIYYIAQQDKLVNASDIPKIFPSFHDAIVEGALIPVHKRLGDDNASEKCKVAFAKRLEDIKAYASDRLPDEVGILEGQDSQGGWAYNWGQNSMS